MEWAPTTRQIFFVGGDHNGCEKFISYSTVSNSWTIEARPGHLGSCPAQDHSYNYNALDPVGGYFFYNGERYNIAAKAWDLSFSFPSDAYYSRSNWSVEWTSHGYTLFTKNETNPAADVAWVYNFQTRNWSNIAQGTGSTFNIHVMSQYNPTSRVTVFGGGDDTNYLYRLDANRNVTKLKSSPIADLSLHPGRGIVATPEPVTGGFLFYTASGAFYHLDAVADRWTTLSGTANFPFAGLGTVNELASVAIPEYGVVVFVQAIPSSSAKMWVYRHAQGGGTPLPPVIVPDAPAALQAH
jgi:hypothetical protein